MVGLAVGELPMSYFYHRAHWDLSRRKMVQNENLKTESQRIGALVEMDEARKRYLSSRDREGLLMLAEAYRTFGQGMPNTARAVRREAERT